MNLSNEPGRVVPLTKAQVPGLTNALHSAGSGPGHHAAPTADQCQPAAGGCQETPRLPSAGCSAVSSHPAPDYRLCDRVIWKVTKTRLLLVMMLPTRDMMVEEKNTAADVKCLRELCRTVQKNSLGQNIGEIHKNLGLVITGCQKLSPGHCQREDEVTSLGRSLLRFLCEGTLAQNSLMLVSTAFCVVLAAVKEPAGAADTLGSCLSVAESRGWLKFELGPQFIELKVQHLECFKMGICYGILQIRTCSRIFEASRNVKNSSSTLASIIFEQLCRHCTSYSRFTFSAFRLLVQWLRKTAEVSKLENHAASTVFSIVNGNWENPLNGVRAQNSRLLQTLLDVCEGGDYTLNGSRPTPLTAAALFERAMWEQPWHVKSKFFILEVVLPKYGTRKALEQFGCLVEGLCWSLSQVTLVSAGTLVYRVCLDDLTEEDWLRYFLGSVLVIMSPESSDISVQEQNLFSYWILPTLKKFPSLLPDLVVRLTADPCIIDRPAGLFAVVSLLRVGQKEGIKLCPVELDCFGVERLVDASLKHGDPVIRSEGVCLLCASLGTDLLQDFRVFDMLSAFLVDNVNADNPQMRQCIVNSFVLFLLRVRDLCAQELKKTPLTDFDLTMCESFGRRDSMQSSLSECFTNLQGEGIVTLTMYFFSWLHKFITSNLEPCSNYQRKILSLQLLQSVLLYIAMPETLPHQRGMFHRKQINDRTISSEKLLTLIVKNELFITDKMRVGLLKCILEQTDDIRDTAGSILMNFFDLSTKNNQEEKSLFRTSVYLCKCSKFFTAESGAVLLQVVAAWLDAEHSERSAGLVSSFLERDFDVWCKLGNVQGSVEEETRDEAGSVLGGVEGRRNEHKVPAEGCSIHDSAVLGDGSVLDGEPQAPPRTVVGLILQCAEFQGDCLQRDLATAAMCGAPLHGLLTALARLVLRPHGTLSPAEVQRLMYLVETTVAHLLGVLSGKAATFTDTSPSFAKMMEAVEEHISDVTEEEDGLYISAAHQTVLSCIWLNLKACCEVASVLGSEPLGAAVAERCAHVIVSVLVLCRHKGAIESAGRSLARLVGETTSRGAAVGESVLEQFLGHLRGGRASTTRRSAGLAILVHRLAIADRLPGKPLLQRALSEVLEVARGPVDADGPELLDCPEGRALHLLRPLVQDSSLWLHIAPLATDLAHLCLSRLACPRWPVRNAALLLFGALVTKIVGKSGCTVEEFLCHYRGLSETLLRHVEVASFTHESPGSHIVPALSLLARLSFTVESFSDSYVSVTVSEFQRCFWMFLFNKDHMVRKLSAKAYANFVPQQEVSLVTESIFNFLKKWSNGGSCNFTQNGLNGIMMLVKCLTEKFRCGGKRMPLKNCLVLHLNAVLNLSSVASYNKELVLEFSKEIQENLMLAGEEENIKISVLEEITTGGDKACVVQEKFEVLHLLTCSSEKLPQFCSNLFEAPLCNEISMFSLAALKFRLAKDSHLTKYGRTHIVCALLSAISRALEQTTMSSTSNLLETVFVALRENSVDYILLSQNVSFQELISRLQADQLAQLRKGCPVTIAVMASLVSVQLTVDTDPATATILLAKVLQFVEEDCRSGTKHEDYRLYAAVSLQILTPSLERLCGLWDAWLGKVVLVTALTLLQDESSAVRNEAAAFVVKLKRNKFSTRSVNPYHCIRQLLSKKYVEEMVSVQEALKVFWGMFSYNDDLKCVHDVLQAGSHLNPYDHGESNIYREECKILELIFSSVVNLLLTDTNILEQQEFTVFVIDKLPSLEGCISSVSRLLSRVGGDLSKVSECYIKLHLILKKFGYQLYIMKQLKLTEKENVSGKLAVCCDLLESSQRRLEYLVMPL